MRRRRQGLDPMLAMINIVFLLLAFFLLGRIEPAPPIAIELPLAQIVEDTNFEKALYIDVDGAAFFEGKENEEAFALLRKGDQLRLNMDGALEANQAVRIMDRLRGLGVEFVIEVRD